MSSEKKSKKNRSKNNKVIPVIRLLLWTVFTILLLSFFIITGIGLNVAISYIEDAPDFDPEYLVQPHTSAVYDYEESKVTRLHDGHNRIEISLEEMPEHLKQAFIAVEDDRFYEHMGISPQDIGRAVINNLREQRLTDQGASTITQQLIKNTILSPERTFERKIQEMWLALDFERQFSKEEILEFYLNTIYFDQSAYGVEAATQTHFGKHAKDLTVAESAMLAAIPRSPSTYSPQQNFEKAKARQEVVLNRMVECGFISNLEAKKAKEETIEIAEPPEKTYAHPYFVDYVEREAKEILDNLDIYEDSQIALNREGLKIYTTLESETQQIAENVLKKSEHYPTTIEDERGKVQPQAAAVLAEPETGYIRALVGGREYCQNNQDLRFLSARQPGSAIKPVLAYVPAIEKGFIYPGSVIDDAPAVFNKDYTPDNYTRRFEGLVTMREALVNSYNVPAVKTYLEKVTPELGMKYGHELGIKTFVKEDKESLSLALGGFTHGTRPIDMAQAFSVIANEGIKTPLTTITKIETYQGEEIYQHNPRREIVLQESTAFLITDVLKDVTRIGTAPELSNVGRPIAAKTGTTSNNEDGWLVSYTPDYVLSTWVGFDYMNIGTVSTRWPRLMSMEIMKKVHEDLPVADFSPAPNNVIKVAVCSNSGKSPSDNCQEEKIIEDYFLKEDDPGLKDECEVCKVAEVCSDSGFISTKYCPQVEEENFIERKESYVITDERWEGGADRKPVDADLELPEESCNIHKSVPSQPQNLQVISDPEKEEVFISWDYDDGQGFNVYRQDAGEGTGENYQKMTSNPITNTVFTDYNVSSDKTYHYKVVAVNEVGTESPPVTKSVTVDESEKNEDNN